MTSTTTKAAPGEVRVSLLLTIDTPRRISINVQAPAFETDWGDETINFNTTVHDYIRPGAYHVRIRGENLEKLKLTSCGCVKATIYCPELTTIDCRNNPLQKLQLDSCNNLTGLNCANCFLEELNVLEAPALHWINCSHNSIKKIDGLLGIKILDANDNLLHSLDLKNCKNIAYLNLANNRFSAIELNDLLVRLTVQPKENDIYVSFMNNPGEASCNTSILELKSRRINNLPAPHTPVKEKETKHNSMKTNNLNTSIPSSISHISLIEKFMDQIMEAFEIHESLRGKISLPIIEAVNNSVLHGNKQDPAKQVKLTVSHSKRKLTVTVEDEGEGFDFSRIPDPTTPGKPLQTSGRGLYLMSILTEELQFVNNGAKVIMTFALPCHKEW